MSVEDISDPAVERNNPIDFDVNWKIKMADEKQYNIKETCAQFVPIFCIQNCGQIMILRHPIDSNLIFWLTFLVS